MSHKITSNQSVVYNAQTQETSALTAVITEVQFTDNEEFGGGSAHKVSFGGGIWANHGTETAQRIAGVRFTLTEEEWNTHVESLSLISETPYDEVLEAALQYTAVNIEPMFGLTPADWTVQL